MADFSFVRELLFPHSQCLFCGGRTDEMPLCQRCQSFFAALNPCACCASFVGQGEDFCPDCLRFRDRPFVLARAALPYEEELRQNLLAFKYNNQTWLHRPLARLLTMTVKRYYQGIDFKMIIPVPLSMQRQSERGYNQAALCASLLARQMGLPLLTKALIRVKDTPYLAQMSPGQRISVLQGAFAVAGKLPPNSKVLLIDDIYTTGATVCACARTLLRAGAKQIFVATIAAGSADSFI